MDGSREILPGLPAVACKPVHVGFDGGRLTSDAGILLLAAVEDRLKIAERLAACIEDPRNPERVLHRLVEMIRYRTLLIAAGYPDGNHCDALRSDPAFKMARRSQWRLWILSATPIVLLRAGWTPVMAVVRRNGSTRQRAPRELAELNGEAPAHPTGNRIQVMIVVGRACFMAPRDPVSQRQQRGAAKPRLLLQQK